MRTTIDKKIIENILIANLYNINCKLSKRKNLEKASKDYLNKKINKVLLKKKESVESLSLVKILFVFLTINLRCFFG